MCRGSREECLEIHKERGGFEMKKWVKAFLIQKLTDEYDYCEKVKNMPALIRKSSLPSEPVLVIGDERRHIFAPTAIFLTDDKSSGTALAHCLQCTFLGLRRI
jgi:hypothetical protein